MVELDEPRTRDVPGGHDVPRRRRDGTAAAGEEIELPAGTVTLPAGAAVPVAEGIDAQTGDEWSRPVSETGRVSPRVRLLAAAGDVPRARWACRTSSSASTRTRTARPRGARPCACSACWRCSTRSRPSTGCSGARSCPSCTLTGDTDSVVLRAAGGGVAGAARRAARRARRRRARSRPSCRRRRACWCRWPGRSRSTSGAAAPGRSTYAGGASASPRRRACSCRSLLALARARARHLGARRLGVRARGEHVLPAAAARHLVGAADRARRRGGADRRRRVGDAG